MEPPACGYNRCVSVRSPRALLEPLRVGACRPLAFAYTINELGNWLGDVALALIAENFVLAPLAALAVLDGALALAGRALVRASVVAVLKPIGLLRSGNAVLNFGFTGAAAVGPLAAAGAVSALGVPAALLIDAASFLAA